jgi:hypothetical protein
MINEELQRILVAIWRQYPSMHMEGVGEIIRETQTQKPQQIMCQH